MPVGSRSTFRIIKALFDNKRIRGKQPYESTICNAACDVFCDFRNQLLDVVLDPKPDFQASPTREILTDIKNSDDVLLGGGCVSKCECPIPKHIQDKMAQILGEPAKK